MIIDYHLHLARAEHEKPWTLEWMRSNLPEGMEEAFETFLHELLTPERIRSYLQENNIDYAVGLAEVSPITTGWTSNEYVGEFCAKANALPDPDSGPKGRLWPFASLNPFIVTDLAVELQRLVDEYDFKGIKVLPSYQQHYPNDTRMYPLYQKALDLGLPVLAHTGSSVFKGTRIKYADPLHWDDVAVDFPDLVIVMAHSGRPFWYDRAFWMARRHENVYMEVSGLPGKKLMEYFPRLGEIARKTIYGSDWPGNPDLQRNVDAIRSFDIADKAKQDILYNNAARIMEVGK